ncbi:MAG: MFS transporter [Planctomycetes bacterium]|nr:MFS transporter [Planctomycetota bacterium]
MSDPRPARPRSLLGIVFLTVFLDIAGMSILFPIFPHLLDHYVALEGPDSAIGRLAAWLREFAGDDQNAVVTLFGGVLGGCYALMQFLAAPVWGAVSDRVGRRRTLLLTVGATAFAHFLWVFAGTFSLLIVARLLAGAMAGNVATAAAVVADTTTGRQRAHGMGMVGMGIGLGFVVGPALGGGLSLPAIALQDAWPGGVRFGVNPFSTPALGSLLLALLNLLWIAKRLPETRPATPGRTDRARATLHPFAALHAVRAPGILRTHVIYLLQLTAFGALEFTLTFLAVERFSFTVGDNAWMFVFIGLLIALVQGGLVRRVVPRFGEIAVARAGFVVMLPGFVAIGLSTTATWLYVGLAALSVGSALAMPSLGSLVSRYSPRDRQGLTQGTLRSMGSLSRAIGPVIGGLLYWRFGSTAPALVGGAAMLLPLAAMRGLPPIPTDEHAAAGH